MLLKTRCQITSPHEGYLTRHGENQNPAIPALPPCPDPTTAAIRSDHLHCVANAWNVYAHQPLSARHADHRGDAVVGAFLSGIFHPIFRITVRYLAAAGRHPRRRAVSRLFVGKYLRLVPGNALVDTDTDNAWPPPDA